MTPWVFVFVGHVEFAPLSRRDVVSFGRRGRCAFLCDVGIICSCILPVRRLVVVLWGDV